MRKTFLRKKPMPPEFALQITSMADIFLILLVFLLKGYASSVTGIVPTAGTRLPVAITTGSTLQPVRDAVTVEISRGAILVEGKPITPLVKYAFPPTAPGTGEAPEILLDRALDRERFRAAHADAAQAGLRLLADEHVPYATVERVLARMASAGFIDLQLVVVRESR